MAKAKSKKEIDTVNPISSLPPSQNPEVVALWEILTHPEKYKSLIKDLQAKWAANEDRAAKLDKREKALAAREKKVAEFMASIS